MTILSYVMPAASFLFMTFQPGAVQLYFFTSALLAFAQSRLLTNDTFRRLMNLHPTVPTPRKTTNTIPAPSVGSNNTPAAPGTLTTTPGGLKLYQPPRPTTPYSSTAANPTRDVSIIDKFVDGAKAHKNQATEGWNNIMGTTKEKKVQQSRMESEKRRADEYDERMKREDQWRREQEREQERENGYVETGKRKEGAEEKTPTPGKVPKGRKRGQKIRR
jgi:YidC/Oxa1 family membrane protein insertase